MTNMDSLQCACVFVCVCLSMLPSGPEEHSSSHSCQSHSNHRPPDHPRLLRKKRKKKKKVVTQKWKHERHRMKPAHPKDRKSFDRGNLPLRAMQCTENAG